MYKQFVNKRAPLASWILDDTVPFQEYTGFNVSGGKKSGTADPSTSVPLVSGAAFSSVFDKASLGEFTQNIFKVGLENRPFALEAWILPVPKTEGFSAQTYRENLSITPVPQAVITSDNHNWQINGSYWSSQSTQTIETNLTGGILEKFYRKTITATTNTSNGILCIGANPDNTTLGASAGIPVTPGDVITVSLYVRYSLATITNDRLKYRFYDASFTALAPASSTANIAVTQNAWNRLSVTFTVPAGASWLAMRTDVNATAIGATFDATGLLVEKSSTLGSYFDGSRPGMEFAGTAWNSISRTRKDVSLINYAIAPQPTYSVSPNWQPNAGTGGVVTTARPSSGGPNNAPYMSMTWTTVPTGSQARIQIGIIDLGTLMEGDTWHYDVWAWINRAQTIKAYVDYQDANGNFISTVQPGFALAANTWTRISANGTAPKGTSRAYLFVARNAYTDVQVGDELRAADAIFVKNPANLSASTNFFTGNSNGAAWSGTVGGSWSYMVTSAADQQILSHDGIFDGLSINGKVIRFGTSYVTSGDAFCDYDLTDWKLAHVVGVHNASQNLLYVNGELVAQIDLTDAQKGDTYVAAATGLLYSGYTISSAELAMNGVAVYASLSGDQVKQNYLAGIDFIGQARVAPQYGGTTIPMSGATGSIFFNKTWAIKDDFELGRKNNVEFAADQINPGVLGGVNVDGDWTVAVPLDAQNDLSIYGVMVSYSGKNVTVDCSLDGITWTPVVSGELVTNIPNAMDPTGKDLQIRVSFKGSQPDAWLESLTAVAYRDGNLLSLANRTITATWPAVPRFDYETNLYRDDNGIYLDGATITISDDTSSDPDVARTVEIWYKSKGSDITHNITGTSYRNGAAFTAAPRGEWSLLHVVASADIVGNITMSGDVIIGQMVIYPTALTAQNILDIWKSYTGQQFVRFTETNTIGVTETGTAASIYAKDWAISSAG